MIKPEGYDQEVAFTGEYKSITPGGHICKIIQAKEEQTKHSNRTQLVILFDIAEGENKNFYADQYAQKSTSNPEAKWQGVYRQLVDGTSTKFFKGMITAIENSNPGFAWNWDEKTLKGKLFGGVFGQEEYEANDGSIKLATKCFYIRSVEQVKKGVEVPKIKTLNSGSRAVSSEVFPDDDIPF